MYAIGSSDDLRNEMRAAGASGGRSLGALRFGAVAALLFAAVGCGGPAGDAGGGHGGFSVNVRTAEAVLEPVEEQLSLVASLTANESVEVKCEIEGAVDQINFEEGQPVTNGQVLVTLDTRKWAASVAEAEAEFKLAEANQARAQTMLSNSTIAQQEYDQAGAAFASRRAVLDRMRQELRQATIQAPFDGVTGARLVSPGQVISRDTVLTTLVQIKPLKVEFRVPERYAGQLQVGQACALRVPAFPGEEFRGEVYFIDPQVELESRTVLVKAHQANSDGQLRPGMFGNLDLVLSVKPKAVVVPEIALMADGERAYVYIVDSNQTAQAVDVEVGVRMPGRVEISKGLKGGEQVIVEGVQKVQPGVPVQPTPAEAALTNAPVETAETQAPAAG